MNTKTDGISSGLVAVAWMVEDLQMLFFDHAEAESYCDEDDSEPLVRLSDAEALIAEKDAEIIEQCRINGMGAERELALLGQIERQSAALRLARPLVKNATYSFIDSVKANEALAAIDALGE